MSMFSKYLYQLIQNRAISISRLARDSGVERTAIHKALNGERVLPYPAVELLGNCLKLSPEEIRRLRQYYDMLFESENMKRAKEIIDRIFFRLSEVSVMRQNAIQARRRLYNENRWKRECVVTDALKEKSIWKGYAEISRLIQAIISEEMKDASPRMELAVPSETLIVREYIEQIYKGWGHMEIFHMLCFGRSESVNECNLQNLEALGCVLPACFLSEGKYHVYYYYSEEGQNRYTNPFPYFLVTHADVICFSENCQTAIRLTGTEQADYFRTCFYHLRQSCHKLAEYQESRAGVLAFWEKGDGQETNRRESGVKDRVYAIMSQPCFERVQLSGFVTLFTLEGIRDFLQKGGQDGFIDGLKEVDGREERIKTLQCFLNSLETGSGRGRIFDDMHFLFPKSLEILISLRNVLLYDRNGMVQIQIREEKLCRAFYEWAAYLADSECVFDEKRTIEIVREMVDL